MKTALSLHNTLAVVETNETTIPEWVQLLPSGTFTGDDGRGPFVVENAEQIIAASFMHQTKLPLDENHSTDVAQRGEPTPACGWIVEMQSRSDGIWGRVEWNKSGLELLADRQYGFISPAIMHTASSPHKVSRILRASLVNEPNFKMKSLHKKEPSMEKELRELLDLDDKADAKSIMSTVRERLEAGAASAEALATAAKSLNLKEDATGDEVITSLNAKLVEEPAASGDETEVAELRKEITSLNKKLTEVVSTNAKATAESVIDKAVSDLKIVPALRDHYVTRHMKDPAEVENELKLMPSLHAGGLGGRDVIETDEGSLNKSDAEVCSLMGLDQEAFAKQAKETGKVFS